MPAFSTMSVTRAVAVVDDDAEVLRVGHVLGEDERPVGACGPTSRIASLLGVLEDVVAEDDDERLAGGEVARHADDLRDPAGLRLHLVGQVELEQRLGAVAARDVPVAEQVDHLARVLLAGDDEHFADAGELEQLERVVDHRPAADRAAGACWRRASARRGASPRRRRRGGPSRGGCYWGLIRRYLSRRADRHRSRASHSPAERRCSERGRRDADHACETRRQPPVPLVEDLHRARDEQGAHDRDVDAGSPPRARSRTAAGPTIEPATKPMKAANMIRPAAVTSRPVFVRPVTIASSFVAPVVPLLAHAADEKHLVVHREAEEHREEHHRDPALDLVVRDQARPARLRPRRRRRRAGRTPPRSRAG